MSNEFIIQFGRIAFFVFCAVYLLYKLYKTFISKDMTLEDLNDQSVQMQDKMIAEFNLGNFDRWHFDQETGQLTFYDEKDTLKVIANCQVLGSFSKNSNSWLFSWANPTILDNCKEKLSDFRELLFESWGEIIDEQIDAEDDAFDYLAMIPLAMNTLEARGYYRAPSERSDTYLIITDIKWA